jgi:hypothetical protein
MLVVGVTFAFLAAQAPATPSYLDRVQAQTAPAPVADALVPPVSFEAGPSADGKTPQGKTDIEKVLAQAEAQLPVAGQDLSQVPPEKRPDPKKALALFQRAYAADPTRAAPLWGMSRAADALGDRKNGRFYARLVVRSSASDKTAEMAHAASWRVELPE